MSPDYSGKKELPPNFVVYDHDNPSSLFLPDKVAYIESISAYLDEEDVRRIRDFERFSFNLNTGLVGSSSIPGLRVDPDRGHIYVMRFSKKPWQQLIRDFDSNLPHDFPDAQKSFIDMIRITTSDGDMFYPFTFFGDQAAWRSSMEVAAERSGTVLAEFHAGRFDVSDGRTYSFSQLSMMWLPHGQPIPADW